MNDDFRFSSTGSLETDGRISAVLHTDWSPLALCARSFATATALVDASARAESPKTRNILSISK